jgi:hypothetical protein
MLFPSHGVPQEPSRSGVDPSKAMTPVVLPVIFVERIVGEQ